MRSYADTKSPSELRFQVDMLQLQQQPFGRARAGVRAIRALKSAGTEIVRVLKEGNEEEPDWLRPPERASYPLGHGSRHYVQVPTDPAQAAWLNRVFTEAPRRMAEWVLVTAWLRRNANTEGEPLEVYIADHQIGVLGASEAARFAGVLRAAAFYDEDPLIRARLSRYGNDTVPMVELAATANGTNGPGETP